MNRILRTLSAIVLLIYLFACNSYKSASADASKKESIKINNAGFQRDKMFVEYTIRNFMDSGYWAYDYYLGFKKEVRDAEVKIYIDDILYSPDSLKMIAVFAIDRNDNLLGPKLRYQYYQDMVLPDHFFSEHSVIGVREDLREPWSIYIFQMPYAIGDKYHEVAKQQMMDLLFKQIKKWKISCYDLRGKEHKSTFKYAVNQSEFWTGPLWRKDCYEGYAYYEVKDHRSPYDLELAGKKVREVWPLLKIAYPDSLLRLF